MDPNLKQRLVGATVLSALAVIFVPMIFDDSGSNSGDWNFEIPEIPAELKQSPPEPTQHLSDAELGVASDNALPVPSEPASTPVPDRSSPENPEDEKQPSLKAWIIQVGSFSKRENADSLRNQLRKAGYPAYVETSASNGMAIFRVRVGPELDRERALHQRDRIALKFKTEGILLGIP